KGPGAIRPLRRERRPAQARKTPSRGAGGEISWLWPLLSGPGSERCTVLFLHVTAFSNGAQSLDRAVFVAPARPGKSAGLEWGSSLNGGMLTHQDTVELARVSGLPDVSREELKK